LRIGALGTMGAPGIVGSVKPVLGWGVAGWGGGSDGGELGGRSPWRAGNGG